MKVVWHGHSCFEIGDGATTIVIDPHDGRSLGIKAPSASAQIVLVTHNHYDHNAIRIIRGNHADFVERDGMFSHMGVDIEGLETHRDSESGGRYGKNVMYLFTMDGISVCHCGDIGDMPSDRTIERIKGVDVLMVPIGEVSTIAMDALIRLMDAVSPKIVVPMHYHVCGLSLPLRNTERFLDAVGTVDYVGERFDISQDELPQSTEYWVFSR